MDNNGHPQFNIADRSFDFAVRIIKLSQSLDKTPGTSRTLAKQLLRSGTSIGANISEAQAAQSKRDFIAKMSISSKEARETLYWLRLLVSANILKENLLQPLIHEATELVAVITSIVKNASNNPPS